ncbi:MAG: hypothetical protein K1X72_17495 [Pyrinomonadaceae bacterium]|nr:hypothetical protein [Pyrinomonadaceae bacterium]
MKILILFLLISVQTILSQQTYEPKVNGIGVGTTYSTILKKLGKPLLVKKGGEYPCDSGRITIIRYSGLRLNLIKSFASNKLIVASMEVTLPKWSVSGIRIGAKLKDVKAKLTGNIRRENSFDILGGVVKDGYRDFYFQNKRLVKMTWELNPC